MSSTYSWRGRNARTSDKPAPDMDAVFARQVADSIRRRAEERKTQS